MAGLLPEFTGRGIFDYVGFAAGLMIAGGVLRPLFGNLLSSLRKNGGA